jgi:uncharacterized protein (DUF2236 family)
MNIPRDGHHMSWKLHREVVLLLGWGRAILLQIAHPLVAQGVADHSGFLAETRGRWRRLHRTLGAMLALTFGTEEDRVGIARRINAIHDRVNGRLARACGVFPEGAAYTAKDPRLLTWVHATLLDSFLLTYELYVGPLRPEEKDRYCAEASEIEPMLEIPAGALPRSTRELARYLDAMLGSGEIAVSDTARLLARGIVTPPVPFPARPFLGVARLPTVGLLPPAVREAYGFGWDPRRAAALRLSGTLVRRLLPLTPSVLRHWPAARAALRRQRAPTGRSPSRTG